MRARDFLESMYQPDDRDRWTFGDLYTPPVVFAHGQWHQVARLDAQSDGQPVEIDECRMPARFFRLRALATETREAWTLSTGSGDDMGALMLQLGRAIAGGMVGLRKDGET